uniref:Uncharacterized protein n=1 Tax=Strongyloides papillosus TaxID=174720 RepID=A0A0N5C9B2_STREA
MFHSCIVKGSFLERNFIYLICKIITISKRWLKIRGKKTLYTKVNSCAKTFAKEAGNKMDDMVNSLKDEIASATNIVTNQNTKIAQSLITIYDEIIQLLLEPLVFHFLVILILFITIFGLFIYFWNRRLYFSKIFMERELSTAIPLQNSSSVLGKGISLSAQQNNSHIVKTANINFDQISPFPSQKTNDKKSNLNLELQVNINKNFNGTVKETSQLDDVTDWGDNLKTSPNKKCKFIGNNVDHVEEKNSATKKNQS